MGYRLLVVSADVPWANNAAALAAATGHQVERTSGASDALTQILEGLFDLALLDADLPALERLRWLEALRQTDEGRALPVIVASRRRDDDELARAFELGADDFVLKSCDPLELSARLRSVLRRRFERAPSHDAAIKVGQVTLDPARHECLVRKTRVDLNPREFELLETLMRRAGRVLTRPYLLETVWRMSRFSNTRTVDVAVSRLRKALGPRAARWLETVDRYGYRFRAAEDFAR